MKHEFILWFFTNIETNTQANMRLSLSVVTSLVRYGTILGMISSEHSKESTPKTKSTVFRLTLGFPSHIFIPFDFFLLMPLLLLIERSRLAS